MAKKNSEGKNRFEQMLDYKHAMIDNFPHAIVFVAKSPITKELVSQVMITDAIDAMARQKAGADIDIKDFVEHLEKIDSLTKTLAETNERLIEKIVNNDNLFQTNKSGKLKPKLKPGLILNKQVRQEIERRKKELLPSDEDETANESNSETDAA